MANCKEGADLYLDLGSVQKNGSQHRKGALKAKVLLAYLQKQLTQWLTTLNKSLQRHCFTYFWCPWSCFHRPMLDSSNWLLPATELQP